MSRKNRKRIPLQGSVIRFQIGKKKFDWNIINNLHKRGLDIENAFWSYMTRTDRPTDIEFCEYLMAKDPEHTIALTKEEFDQLAEK